MGQKAFFTIFMFSKNLMVFVAGIFAVCMISIIAMSWDEIKDLLRKKKTH
jgi:hypothetical protein